MAKSDPSPASVVVALVEDGELRGMPDSALAERLVGLFDGFNKWLAVAGSAVSWTVRHAVAMGQVFSEGFRRHDGEFGDWLRAVVGEDAEGNPRISVDTARRYRTLWAKRDLLFPADGAEPHFRNLSEAYTKVGLLPMPVRDGKSDPMERPLFRLSFTVPEVAPELWPPAERRSFLERTEPIAQLRERLVALG
jgi:hypothetical protein